eukprot:9348617-Ditylum_brightwellii.AAC.2
MMTIKIICVHKVILVVSPDRLKCIKIDQQSNKSVNLEDKGLLMHKVTGLTLRKLFGTWPTCWWSTVNYTAKIQRTCTIYWIHLQSIHQ